MIDSRTQVVMGGENYRKKREKYETRIINVEPDLNHTIPITMLLIFFPLIARDESVGKTQVLWLMRPSTQRIGKHIRASF